MHKQQKHKTRRQKKLSAWGANMRPKDKRGILLEATLNRTKPLDELEREREELKRKIEEDRRIMNDKTANPRGKDGRRGAVFRKHR